MLTLGINYGLHDSAAAIAADGEILFAIAEERLSRKKHYGGFPQLAISACLAKAQASVGDLDDVAFGWQSATSIRKANIKNYLSGSCPARLYDVVRDLTLGTIDDYRVSGERLFSRHFGAPKNGFRRIDHHH